MPDLEFLDGYSGESTEALLAYEARYRTDSIVLAFEQALLTKEDEGQPLSDEERVVVAVEALEREVNNGGFDQFFENGSNAYASFIVGALERIGCPATAAITRDALTALELGEAPTTEAIDEAMEADSPVRTARLEKCDEAYYAAREPIAGRLLEFIKAHRSAIRLG